MSDLATLNRSISLDSAASDFTKYAKALMASKGQPDDALPVIQPLQIPEPKKSRIN
jgi:hypothetical protein